MESRRFDNISRVMASGTSRRTVLRGVFGGAFAAIGLRSGATAQPNKVDICHHTGNGSYHHINVSVNALDAHLAHGDFTECEGNFELDDSCNCVCSLSECDAGLELNFDTCSCDPIPSYCDTFGVDCGMGGNGFCAENIDQGGLICVTFENDCDNPCDEGCPEGMVCVRDGGCGKNHCHRPYA